MIEKIQMLYSQIEKKTKFIKEVAADLNKSPLTLRNHWFSAFWSIPEESQARVVELLEERIQEQNSVSI